MERDPPAADDGLARLLDSAAEVARSHVAEPDGRCAQCLRTWGRAVWFPCEQARWAHAVLDRYGDPGRGPGSGEAR